MAAAGRRWQRCSSCGCRLMSASGQRLCWRSHGRGHHLPGRSTSIRALWRTAWLHESACWAVAVERWARRGGTRRRKGLFQPFVRYSTHLDLEAARRYSAAPVWPELGEALALDPQRRRPLLMWQGHSRHPWLCPCRDRRVGRLFGSIVRGALNIRIRWRPPSAHQAAAAAGRAIGAPHRYHRSAPSQCSTA